MSMTKDDSYWHRVYEASPASIKGEIDAAYTAATESMRAAGLKLCNSDGAECFVGAITRYVYESDNNIVMVFTEKLGDNANKEQLMGRAKR